MFFLEKEEEEARCRKAEIGFDYGTSDTKHTDDVVGPSNDDSDSESEPFEPPPGIKLPLGLAVVSQKFLSASVVWQFPSTLVVGQF